MLVDELYNVLDKNIPDYEGKICLPLSGGLDSRVIGGLLSKRRKIDLVYTHFELEYPIKQNKGLEGVQIARQIASKLNTGEHYVICLNNDSKEDREAVKGLPNEKTLLKSKMYTGLRLLNEQVDTSEYTFIAGHGLDSFTGIAVTPLTILFGNPYKNDIITKQKKLEYFGGIFDGTYGKFGKWDCPLWNDEVEQFCLDLPLSDRFFQKLYRQMITKYFPELAVINREIINCPVNANEFRYFYKRLINYIKKKIKE